MAKKNMGNHSLSRNRHRLWWGFRCNHSKGTVKRHTLQMEIRSREGDQITKSWSFFFTHYVARTWTCLSILSRWACFFFCIYLLCSTPWILITKAIVLTGENNNGMILVVGLQVASIAAILYRILRNFESNCISSAVEKGCRISRSLRFRSWTWGEEQDYVWLRSSYRCRRQSHTFFWDSFWLYEVIYAEIHSELGFAVTSSQCW